MLWTKFEGILAEAALDGTKVALLYTLVKEKQHRKLLRDNFLGIGACNHIRIREVFLQIIQKQLRNLNVDYWVPELLKQNLLVCALHCDKLVVFEWGVGYLFPPQTARQPFSLFFTGIEILNVETILSKVASLLTISLL